jgi:hypothetical protein
MVVKIKRVGFSSSARDKQRVGETLIIQQLQ